MFALQNASQGGSTIPKWNPCCRVGINLGSFHFYDCNVYIVLNPTTGLVSLQHHCFHNDFRKMIRQDVYNTPVFWTQLAGHMTHDTMTTQDESDASAGQHVAAPLADKTDNGTTGYGPSDQEAIFFSNKHDDMAPPQSAKQWDQADQNTITVFEEDSQPPLIETLEHSSRGRQCKMSCVIQDSVEQGFSQNFA